MKTLLLSLTILLSFSALAQPPAYVPANGLVGWWPFSGNANDESGISNHGYTFGTNTPTLQFDRFNSPNSAYFFYGDSGEIKIPIIDNQLLLDPLLDSYSVSFWLKSLDPTLSSSTGLALQQWGGNLSHSYPFSFQIIASNNSLQPKVFDGNNVNTTVLGDMVFDDQWHMITMVKNNLIDSLYAYTDGVLIDAVQFTLTGPLDPIYDTIKVGPRFLGAIDDIGIWNRALSNCEITELYTTQACNVGTEELLQSEKKLIKIIDFMGRETQFKPNIPLILIYSDGTRERVMEIEE